MMGPRDYQPKKALRGWPSWNRGPKNDSIYAQKSTKGVAVIYVMLKKSDTELSML